MMMRSKIKPKMSVSNFKAATLQRRIFDLNNRSI